MSLPRILKTSPGLRRRTGPVRRFFVKAADDNVTGMSAMVAYNLLASIIPLGLLALFIAGRVLRSPEYADSILADLRRLFPDAAEGTLTSTLTRLENNSTTIGILALVSSVWISCSFWGAIDTAFCRIYHVRCRRWVEQKRFGLVMLVVVLLFMAATIAVPAVQSVLVEGARDLPLGLDDTRQLVFWITLVGGLLVVFAILCVVYRAVPNRRVPWTAIWPGALGATAAMALVDFSFPFYLSNVSTISTLGTTLVFIVLALVWFYALAIIILGGGVLNAIRYERHEERRSVRTLPSEIPSRSAPAAADSPAGRAAARGG